VSDTTPQISLKLPNNDTPAPPAYFLSVEVEDFRCFGPRQVLDLSDGNGHPASWTILLGDNGVGKTTLLQSLALFQPEVTLFPADESRSEVEYIVPGGLGFFRNPWFIFEQLQPNSFVGVTLYLGDKLSQRKEGQFVGDYYIKYYGMSGTDSNIKGLICYGYGASRRLGKTSLSERDNQDSCASLFYSDIELLNAEEWLLQADYAVSRQSHDLQGAKRRLDQIKSVLRTLLPGVEELDIAPSKRSKLQAIVRFKTPFGWVRMQDLSLGYTTMISWIVDFASRLFDRYPNSENPLTEPAICLIDEIDLHLHPKWQRTIMDFLCNLFPNTQFIATAHSPLIVQAASATNANIVLLRREDNHVVIDNNPQSIANWRVDQILTSELFDLPSARPPDLDKALEERQRILSKPKLTKADRTRLRQLETQIGDLPTGETPADIEAMDIIRRAAELLKNN
jgi:predicted ATP-binding protein involved in virulence